MSIGRPVVMSLQPYSCATSCRRQLEGALKTDQSAPEAKAKTFHLAAMRQCLSCLPDRLFWDDTRADVQAMAMHLNGLC